MKQVINADPHGKIALQGYDPVAFHSVGKAVKGNPAISAEYRGYKYLFSSDANKAIFEKEAEKYLPAYGGFCAFGVSLGVLFPVEIDTWEIVDGRLVLQYNLDIKQKFEEDKEGNLLKANDNWPKIEKEKVGN
ncbi:MAG: YHS domain-containing protein [Proteobacteria bacterium]|nr:YHS domain-containing protein [Pseudomonadota bacterium]